MAFSSPNSVNLLCDDPLSTSGAPKNLEHFLDVMGPSYMWVPLKIKFFKSFFRLWSLHMTSYDFRPLYEVVVLVDAVSTSEIFDVDEP